MSTARLGPFSLKLPAVLDARIQPEERPANVPTSPALEAEAAGGPGTRRIAVVSGTDRWSIEFPIPTPEVTATGPNEFDGPDHVVLTHGPPGPSVQERWRAAPPAAIVLTNARALWTEGAPFVDAVAAIRESAGPGPLLWTPRVALPHRIAFLAYLGVDLMDSTEALFQASEGQYLDAQLGTLDVGTARSASGCMCPGCASNGSLLDHARFTLRSELGRVHAAAWEGRLRDLSESRLPADPRLGEMLRFADRRLRYLLEETSPVEWHRPERYVIAEAARRPEVVRFRERFLARYRPPASKRVLLLVPCSETKPYRRSPSHRRFLRALDGLRPLERVHFSSVTSPLGIVPRELEDIFPARQYDIPVTGDWTEPEREAVRRALVHLLATGSYEHVIAHLDSTEYAFLRDPVNSARSAEWTVMDGRAGSAQSLQNLRAAVAQRLDGCAPVPGGALAVVREELESVASFQFGADGGRRLLADPLRLAGRPWFQRVTDGHHVDLATWREERGLFQLTVAGGLRLLEAHPLEVEVDPAIRLEGDLFCPGVLAADPGIRVGDACLLVCEGRLLGVGEATLPGRWMCSLSHGRAVRVRHRAHPPLLRAGAATGT